MSYELRNLRLSIGFLAMLLVACGGTNDASTPWTPTCESDWLGPLVHNPNYDDECAGNEGCTEVYTGECGCYCAFCEGERCVASICDDSCSPPPCPTEKPAEGAACSRTSYAQYLCDYPRDAESIWHCECKSTEWSCAERAL